METKDERIIIRINKKKKKTYKSKVKKNNLTVTKHLEGCIDNYLNPTV